MKEKEFNLKQERKEIEISINNIKQMLSFGNMKGALIELSFIVERIEQQEKEFIKRAIDKEMILQIPKDAIGGRGGEFIKVIEIKELLKLAGDDLK